MRFLFCQGCRKNWNICRQFVSTLLFCISKDIRAVFRHFKIFCFGRILKTEISLYFFIYCRYQKIQIYPLACMGIRYRSMWISHTGSTTLVLDQEHRAMNFTSQIMLLFLCDPENKTIAANFPYLLNKNGFWCRANVEASVTTVLLSSM